MELFGILITACALDQPQAKETDIEIDIRLHIAGDQGDVMDAAWLMAAHVGILSVGFICMKATSSAHRGICLEHRAINMQRSLPV
ncbi:hypothetical protein [Mesorhizobium sp. B2-4-12]|uniref:hypothetical protein n=1 Tax=Mesorhizobium sp. B2-4-12 TaxID=2589937 RepID=UPI001FEDB7FB|nr:hypothetical protein [Mesorhizobium sp. B2-4-12]